MAWYDELYFSTSNSAIQGWIGWTVSTNVASNKSTVTCNVQYSRTNDGYSTYGTFSGTVTCNGVSKEISKYVTLSGGSWVTVGIVSFDVPHNSDGSKSCTISVSGSIPGTSFSSSSGSKSTTLPKIPREPKINSFSLKSRTPVSAVFSWGADSTINQIQYKLNSGSWSTVNVNAKSGSYTLSGLTPNTSYSTTLKVRRSDSNLWSGESKVSFSTLNVPTISSSVNFNIGSNLAMTFSNPGKNSFTIKFYIGSTLISTSGSTSSTSYTWTFTSDQITKLYQNCTGKKTLNVTFSTVTSLGGKTFEKKKSGTATVVESSNKPSTPAFTFANTDTTSNTLLGVTNMAIQGIGNIRATITTLSTAKNSATIVSYIGGVVKDGTTFRYAEATASSSVYLDFASPNSSGTYTLRIYAVDSRGFSSAIAESTFVVIPYHQPSLSPSLNRINNYEKETLLYMTGYYSSIKVNNVTKNSLQKLQYRYGEVGKDMGAYINLPLTSSKEEGNDVSITVTKNESSPFLTLENDKSYNIEFLIQDKLLTNTQTAFVSQGIPACSVTDNGVVSIRRIPDPSGKALQVTGGADISGDLLVNQVNILASLQQLNSTFLDKTYPVGSIYLSIKNTNPGTLFGGTWSAWGTGRVPIGISTGDSSFNTVEKTGGAKTINISHSHTVSSHKHLMTLGLADNYLYFRSDVPWGRAVNSAKRGAWTLPSQSTAPTSQDYTNNASPGTNSQLSSSQSILPPYITCYMWKRTS